MRLTPFGHSCVRLTDDRGTLVLDPGTFSDPAALDGADAVLVTHEHGDHLDVSKVAAALEASVGLQVWGPQAAVDLLVAAGAPVGRITAVTPGQEFLAAGHGVHAVGTGLHELIHRDVPLVANVGYFVDGAVLAPGDAYITLPSDVPVEVLLLPMAGPWLRIAEVVDYVRAVSPRVALGVHDAFLSDVGRSFVERLLGPEMLGAGQDYEILPPGTEIDVTPRPDVHAALVAGDLLRGHPEYAEPALLEVDETVPPRPEEQVADDARA